MDIWNELTDAFGEDTQFVIDEMQKKYHNTYLLLIQPNGLQSVVQYQGYESGLHYFKDALNITIKLSQDTQYKVVCAFPERLLFNHNRCALEFMRLPARQFKRGINKDNAVVVSPVRKLWGGSNPYLLHHNLLTNVLFPQYPSSCEEAITQLDKRAVVSIALSSKFMLSLSFSKEPDMYYLFYSNCCIGYFQHGKFYIKNQLFFQEVLDNMHIFKPYDVECV